MQSIPEIYPRISPEQIKLDANIGCGVQLRQKFRFLAVMGVYGRNANFHTICQQLYETSFFTEPKTDKKTKVTKMVETINDTTAYARLDNICRQGSECKSMIQAELDFLRQGFVQLFNANAMAYISDDMLKMGSVLQIIKFLTGSEVSIDWTGVDPMLALNALSVSDEPEVDIEILRTEGTRWTEQPDGVEPKKGEDPSEVFTFGAGYKLMIDATNMPERPFVFEFISTRESETKDGKAVRAQLLPLPIREDDGEGPWRVSSRLNRPLHMSEVEGEFGFCVISGLGLSLDDLFPLDYKPKCLTDGDLRFLVGQVLSHATSATTPVIGIRRYRVVKPDAKQIRTRNRGG